jgi:hypothetical protein
MGVVPIREMGGLASPRARLRRAREVHESLSAYLVERRAELIVGELPTIRGNETLMTQVIQNLIINALTYNKSRTPRVEISGEAQGDRCLIAIRDNGIGIEPQYLNEIFSPLKRLHPSSGHRTRPHACAQGDRAARRQDLVPIRGRERNHLLPRLRALAAEAGAAGGGLSAGDAAFRLLLAYR